MKFTASLFSQILQIVPRGSFMKLVRECGAERYAKGFSSWDQYVAMLFCQFDQPPFIVPLKKSARLPLEPAR